MNRFSYQPFHTRVCLLRPWKDVPERLELYLRRRSIKVEEINGQVDYIFPDFPTFAIVIDHLKGQGWKQVQ